MKASLGLVGLTLFAVTANAILLFNDPFDYPDGALVTVSTNLWMHHSGSVGEVRVASGRALLSEADTEDVHVLLPGQPYPGSSETNVFYASFRARLTTPPGANGSYFAHFKDSGNGFRARIWAFKDGASYGRFRLGVSSLNGSAATATHPMDLSLDTDYTIVTRLVNSNSTSTLWINPTVETDASVSTSEGVSTFTVVSYALRENSGEGVLSVDDLKVGTTFADVLNPTNSAPGIVSGPKHQTITNGADVVFSVTAGGTPPLGYQWRCDGSNIDGAINSNLVLTHVSFDQAGFYTVVVTNGAGSTASSAAALNVWCDSPPAFSCLTYNVHGNGLTNWSTNMWRVQAIGRQIQYLNPDIVTFQEIPVTNNCTAQVQDFVSAFRPGYYLATNSVDDGYIHSVILSRYPVVASRSWLHGVDLGPWGYAGADPSPYFTRDLFEAEIQMPDFPQPLHLFTVHLKANQDPDSAAKRAAEASAVSNFFAAVFLPSHAGEPYILSGDMNEDVLKPDLAGLAPVRRMANPSTGLQITTPVNLLTDSERTWSIQDDDFGPITRYDYILPCAALSSNIVSAQVFRTDLMNPLPANLYSNDDKVASDHLPVFMAFANPFNRPFRLLSLRLTNQVVTLIWESQSNLLYNVEASSNLMNWTPLVVDLAATGPQSAFSTNVTSIFRFYRICRIP